MSEAATGSEPRANSAPPRLPQQQAPWTENIGPGSWWLPEALWARIAALLPPPPSHDRGGRPRCDDYPIACGIFYVLGTGCQWKALPRCFGAPSTVHARFQQWVKAGLTLRLWQAGLIAYDGARGIAWDWQSMDGAMTKAPLGGPATGPNPTDRGKSGTKRSLLTDGRGQPLGLAVAGANTNDHLLTAATLDSIPVPRPQPTAAEPQNLCLDKGYDYDRVRQAAGERDYTLHLRTRGEEIREKRTIPGHRPRRWVVERTHSWINRFRRLLVRWEKKAENYCAMLHLAFAYHLLRAAHGKPAHAA